MKIIVLAFIVAVAGIGRGYCQSAGTGDPANDIQAWLQPGKHATDIMSIKSSVSARQVELSGKVMQAMKKNATWIRDSSASVADSAIIYEKFGLTKAEFEEYARNSDPKQKTPELVKSG
jgi:hypothetical protein